MPAVDLPSARSPLVKITLRGIRSQFGRFLMTLLAVSLGTAFLSGVLGLRSALDGVAESTLGGVAVYDGYLLGPEETTPGGTSIYGSVDASEVDRLREITGVENPLALWTGTGLLYDAAGNLLTTGGAPVLITPTMAGSLGPTWVEGVAPQRAGQIAVEESAANQHQLQVGDRLELAVGGQILPQEVTGIYSYDHPMLGMVSLYVDPDTADQLFGEGGQAPMVVFNLAPGADPTQVLDRVAQPDLTVLDNAQYRAYLQEQADTALRFLTTFLLIFIGIALFVSTFIISNTFQMSVRARQGEFALLRAIGTSRPQVFLVVAAQAVVVGLLGGGLGVLLGRGLTWAAERALAGIGMSLPGGIPLTASMVGWSLLVGLVVTVISALLPALEASRTSPLEALRSSAGANQRALWPRTVLGAMALAGGLALVHLGVTRQVAGPGVSFGVGAALLILGILAVSPALSRPAAQLLASPIRLVSPTQGRLAVKNLWRNPRRTSTTAGALIIGVTLVSAGAVLATTVKDSIAGLADDQVLSNLVVQSADPFSPIPPQAQELIEQVKGVESVHGDVSTGQVSFENAEGEYAIQSATFYGPGYLGRDVQIPLSEGSADGLSDGEFLALSSWAREQGFEVGDEVTFRDGDQTQEHRLGGLMDFNVVGSTLVFDSKYSQLAAGGQFPVTKPAALFVWTEPGADVQLVKAAIQQQVRPLRTLSVGTAADFSNQAAQAVDQVMAVLYALLGLSVVVAAVGIVNTMSLSVAERTREFGLLRAVGMGRGGVAALVIIESTLTSVYAAVLGAATGVGLGAALQQYLQDSGLSRLTVPWGQLGLFVLAAAVLGVLAAIVPAWRAARIPVLVAIAED